MLALTKAWVILSVSIFTFLLLQAILGSVASEAVSFNGGDRGVTIWKKVALPITYAAGIILGLYALEQMKTDKDSKWFWLLILTPFALFIMELSATIGSFDDSLLNDREDIENYCTLMKFFNDISPLFVEDKEVATCKTALAFGFMALFLLCGQNCLAYFLWQSQVQFYSPTQKSVTFEGICEDLKLFFKTRTKWETTWIVWDVVNLSFLLLQAILGSIALRTFYQFFLADSGTTVWKKFSLPLCFMVGNILGGYALEKMKSEKDSKWLAMLLLGPLAILIVEISATAGSFDDQPDDAEDIENYCSFLNSIIFFPEEDVASCRAALAFGFFALFSLFGQLVFGYFLWSHQIEHNFTGGSHHSVPVASLVTPAVATPIFKVKEEVSHSL